MMPRQRIALVHDHRRSVITNIIPIVIVSNVPRHAIVPIVTHMKLQNTVINGVTDVMVLMMMMIPGEDDMITKRGVVFRDSAADIAILDIPDMRSQTVFVEMTDLALIVVHAAELYQRIKIR